MYMTISRQVLRLSASHICAEANLGLSVHGTVPPQTGNAHLSTRTYSMNVLVLDTLDAAVFC